MNNLYTFINFLIGNEIFEKRRKPLKTLEKHELSTNHFLTAGKPLFDGLKTTC